MRKIIILIVLMIGLVSSLEAEIDCPSNVRINEEFVCRYTIDKISDPYDVKFDISKDGSSVARIWDPEKSDFKSAYYYLKDFSGNEVTLKIEEDGDFNSIFKVRVSSTVYEFPFEIEVGEETIEEEPIEEILDKEEILGEDNVGIEEELIISEEARSNEREVISLNPRVEQKIQKEIKNSTVIYESRDARNLRFLPYIFSLFILVVFFIMLIIGKF